MPRPRDREPEQMPQGCPGGIGTGGIDWCITIKMRCCWPWSCKHLLRYKIIINCGHFSWFCALLFNSNAFWVFFFFERGNVKKRRGGALPFKRGGDVYGQCKTETADCRSRANVDCRPQVKYRLREKVEKYDCKSLKLRCNDPSHVVIKGMSTRTDYQRLWGWIG